LSLSRATTAANQTEESTKTLTGASFSAGLGYAVSEPSCAYAHSKPLGDHFIFVARYLCPRPVAHQVKDNGYCNLQEPRFVRSSPLLRHVAAGNASAAAQNLARLRRWPSDANLDS
jgi:hypothetical protein